MPPSTFSPRIRIIISRQLGGKRDERGDGASGEGAASRTASFTVHGVESEEWMMTTMIAYLRYLQVNGFPDIEIKQNQTSRASSLPPSSQD